MDLVHLGGSVNNSNDRYVVSSNFHQFDLNLSYIQKIEKIGAKLNYLLGIKKEKSQYFVNQIRSKRLKKVEPK